MNAFVIMPYDRRYNRVYRNLIKPAVEQLGLTCNRTDLEGAGGHVFRNVANDLASADIVIADITALNWNVSYELGIRHTLRKHGTIIMCDSETRDMMKEAKGQQYPFDIQDYAVLDYDTNWLENTLDDSIIESLKNRIKQILEGNDISDSPVHDVLLTLPSSLLDATAAPPDYEAKFSEMKDQLADLQKRNEQLTERLEKAGLSETPSDSSDSSIQDDLLMAVRNGIYVSDAAVAELERLRAEGDKEQFAEFLGKVLTIGFLDESDCKSVYRMCRELDNPTVTRIFIEKAASLYPYNDELQGMLADTYSTDYRVRDKALLMANSTIGLNKHNGVYSLTPKNVTGRIIASFFNVYLHLNMYPEIIDIATLLLKQYPRHSALITRNLIAGYKETGQLDKACELAEQLVNDDPTNDMSHFRYFDILHALERHKDAFSQLEWCVACDDEDVDYYMSLAGIVMDEHIARVGDAIVTVSSSERERHVLPYLIRAIQVNPSSVNQVMQFLHRNKLISFAKRLVECIQAGRDIQDEFSDLDYSAVNFCQTLQF